MALHYGYDPEGPAEKLFILSGIALGTTMNWATLERIVDAADLAYRRRFLIDKYPHLENDCAVELVVEDCVEAVTADEAISVFQGLPPAGGTESS